MTVEDCDKLSHLGYCVTLKHGNIIIEKEVRKWI